ncbi:RES family NAD+ phosphorylase [Paracoccus fontiphilus]|uniref:RES family NAD+ phosphorylase n=1 Tax=Paracoccus fontiphilus TaxID=1815556 RepID=A0ABV7IHU9_9RHOB|nr:RES domain-containing protein [Paracoccus fontiphilus]
MRFAGLLYRAITPRYAAEPLSGEGARRFGGRFNAKGMPALYLATHFVTAIHEANQVGSLQPTTLVTYDADIENLFDTRDPAALSRESVDPAVLSADTWRDEMRARGISRSQELAAALASRGFHGLISRSYAKGNAANPDATNIVLWTWPDPPARLRVIDDEGRLDALRSP